jgi:hypothetical protein
LLLHNVEVELRTESSIDVICDALLELADMINPGELVLGMNDLQDGSTCEMGRARIDTDAVVRVA